MQNNKKIESLEALLQPVVEDLGFEFVGLEIKSELGRSCLRLLIDRPGGITLDECAMLSREVGPHLEVADPFLGKYALEVSSPGIQRPLKRPQDFERFIGHRVVVRSSDMLDSRKVFKGKNLGVDAGGNIRIEDEAAGHVYAVPLGLMRDARLDPEIKIASRKKPTARNKKTHNPHG